MGSGHCCVLTLGYTVEEEFRQESGQLRQIDDLALEVYLLREPTCVVGLARYWRRDHIRYNKCCNVSPRCKRA